jgi:hypothetical protein
MEGKQPFAFLSGGTGFSHGAFAEPLGKSGEVLLFSYIKLEVVGFVQAGVPLGVTFSFLISSPLVDLASIILLASIFNWKIALVYVLLGLVLAVIGGSLISYLKMEKYVAESG